MDEVLAQRTRHVTVMMENLYDRHNVNASLRSCEALGVQDVYVVDEDGRFEANKHVTGGAAQWLNITHYGEVADGTQVCLRGLKQKGYRIVATTLREGGIPLGALDLSQKVALCFGTEELGLSDEAHELADVFVSLPMLGFTQSFNVSVAVALCLYDLMTRLRSSAVAWQLGEVEQVDLKIQWLLQVPHYGPNLLRYFLQQRVRG
ncbi:MAG: RNA methyltransferase [Ardenticatenaceae bacterium]|nr:RNA methyltransferase [Ardenticatenaceae bacterium]